MRYIRDAYGIPVRRGMKVKTQRGVIGWITKADQHVHVKFNKYLREQFHPFDLDYQIAEGQWLNSADVEKEYNRRLDDWNQRLNERVGTK